MRSRYRSESPVLPWPRIVPCRTHDANAPDVLVATLGHVQTPLADGTFDPLADRVQLTSGAKIERYYCDVLGVKHYTPLDKSVFPLPPSGWCSWYFYYQQITPEEVKRNAEWLGANLLEYGARYCQLDDGWQGVGKGLGENRDWTTMDKRFAAGLADLAGHIRKQGLEAGLWLAPHGQSNPAVVKKWDVFLLDGSGASLSDTWEGKFLLDPTRPRAREYFQDLFRTLCNAGFTYYKIDGQPIVVEEYAKLAGRMSQPVGDPVATYRQTLEWIREVIGPQRFLLGCWGLPIEGAGIYNGSRTAGDIIQGIGGLKLAARAVQRYNYLHNMVWYSDPDCFVVRSPSSIDMARAWATIQGLTGQALLTSDRLFDLSPDRVEILKRIYPAVDIRPLDLFKHGQRLKPIWDLKVNHLGRQYDVVGCFNFDESKSTSVLVQWKSLGLKAEALYHVYDFWNHDYLGCWETGYFAPVPPGGCTVLTLVEASAEPELISTSRHITQGWIDLLRCDYDRARHAYRGRSQLIGGDPYTLTFAYPRSGTSFRIKSARAAGLPIAIANHQGWATLRIDSPHTRSVDWDVTFEPAPLYSFVTAVPRRPTAERAGMRRFEVTWGRPYDNEAGFAVYLDDVLLGITPTSAITLPSVPGEVVHMLSLRSVWWDGTTSAESISVELPEGYAPDAYLSDLEPLAEVQGWGSLIADRNIGGGPLKMGDKTYSKGLGMHADGDAEYELLEKYERFTAEVGVDANNGKPEARVTFEVFGDDRRLWESGPMTVADRPRPIDVDVTDVRVLRLHVGASDDGIDHDHGNWGDARISQKAP